MAAAFRRDALRPTGDNAATVPGESVRIIVEADAKQRASGGVSIHPTARTKKAKAAKKAVKKTVNQEGKKCQEEIVRRARAEPLRPSKLLLHGAFICSWRAYHEGAPRGFGRAGTTQRV
jgi:hypothetical protein